MIKPKKKSDSIGRFMDSCLDRQEVVNVVVPNVLLVKWTRKGVGFGELALVVKDGQLHIDAETMGPRFVKQVLGALVDEVVAAGRLS